MPELSEQMRDYIQPGDDWEAVDVFRQVDTWTDEAEIIETERDAWKEAFIATRAYYSNNNGENSKRYREAVKRLKEMKLIK